MSTVDPDPFEPFVVRSAVAAGVMTPEEARDGWRPAGLDMLERPAREGDRCTCGRKALKVYRHPDGHLIGYCGIPDGGAR